MAGRVKVWKVTQGGVSGQVRIGGVWYTAPKHVVAELRRLRKALRASLRKGKG